MRWFTNFLWLKGVIINYMAKLIIMLGGDWLTMLRTWDSRPLLQTLKKTKNMDLTTITPAKKYVSWRQGPIISSAIPKDLCIHLYIIIFFSWFTSSNNCVFSRPDAWTGDEVCKAKYKSFLKYSLIGWFRESVHMREWGGEGQRERERISSRLHTECRAHFRAQSHNPEI